MTVRVSSYLLGDFELEPDKYLLRRNNETVHLPELPFQVLLYLVENRERYVSRQELLDRFWSGSDGYEETLTRCISTIRTNLNDLPAAPRFIETRKKVGYRYIGPLDVQATTSSFEVERTRGVSIVVEEDFEQNPAIAAEESLPVQVRDPFRVHSSQRRWLLPTVLGIAMIVLTGAGLVIHRSHTRAAPASWLPIHSIAVLPFKPINAQYRDEYLELGMADALIAKLSNLKQLVVRPTSSIRKYASIDQDPIAAGREQSVDAVLDASIQRLGDRVSVTVRLLRVADGSSLWTFHCEEACSDVFAAQDAISEQIAQAIKLSLSEDEKRKLAKHYTDNKEAYQDYLRGRYYWNKKTGEELKKAINYFQSAIYKDPTYALAYAGLSDAYQSQYIYDQALAPHAIPRARAAALKALEIDDSLAEAHASLAPLKFVYDSDFEGAEREFKRAIDLNANYAETHHWFALYLMQRGRHEEAIAEARRAEELDPLSAMISTDVGLVLSIARRYDEAITQFHETLEMSPNFFEAHHLLGQTYIFKGMYAEALKEYQKMIDTGVSTTYAKGEIGYAYAKAGKTEEAKRILRELTAQEIVERLFINIGLGNKDEAFKLLDSLAARHHNFLRFLNTYPLLDDLRLDKRFADLTRRTSIIAS